MTSIARRRSSHNGRRGCLAGITHPPKRTHAKVLPPDTSKIGCHTLRKTMFQSPIALLLSFLALTAHAQKESYVSIETRSGVSQAFLHIEPAEPLAAVILFAGGDGRLGLSPNGIAALQGNFLVRSRPLFADEGLVVAVVDVASDFDTGDGLLGFRSGKKHATDIKGVIAYVKRKAKLPVWVVGTSRGSISAANAAARIEEKGPEG